MMKDSRTPINFTCLRRRKNWRVTVEHWSPPLSYRSQPFYQETGRLIYEALNDIFRLNTWSIFLASMNKMYIIHILCWLISEFRSRLRPFKHKTAPAPAKCKPKNYEFVTTKKNYFSWYKITEFTCLTLGTIAHRGRLL